MPRGVYDRSKMKRHKKAKTTAPKAAKKGAKKGKKKASDSSEA